MSLVVAMLYQKREVFLSLRRLFGVVICRPAALLLLEHCVFGPGAGWPRVALREVTAWLVYLELLRIISPPLLPFRLLSRLRILADLSRPGASLADVLEGLPDTTGRMPSRVPTVGAPQGAAAGVEEAESVASVANVDAVDEGRDSGELDPEGYVPLPGEAPTPVSAAREPGWELGEPLLVDLLSAE